MIVCSCNFITSQDIEDLITSFLDVDEWQLITPGKIYHAMKKRGKCCGCFPGVIDIIVRTTEAYHLRKQSPQDKIIPFIQRIRAEHEKCETARRMAMLAKIQKAA